ncbi:MAG: hypothetical protein HY343_09220 [Lentisphaerae bacterium]|nr:hypothetical protein [Lentisphaerota bacterium]
MSENMIAGDIDKPALWAGAVAQEWANASQAILRTDMTQGSPDAVLSPGLKKGCWKVVPYETREGWAGTMVWAAPEAEAPELAIPLGVQGWFAIFAGLFAAPECPTLAWLRLDGDPADLRREAKAGVGYGSTEEVFFKVARLDETSRLHLSPQRRGFIQPCGLTHIRLIPLAPAEVERLLADRADRSHRTMAATHDGFSWAFYRSPQTTEEWLRDIEIFRDTDFGTLLLHSPGADKVIYPSKIGHMKGVGVEVFPRPGDRYFVEAIQAMARQGVNPLKVLIDGAHDVGMKVHVGIRPAGWSFVEPYLDYWEPAFYRQNPQWRCVDRDGTPVARMSWAVPEVRKHLIELLREQVGFGADGAHVVFNRGFPVVLYEPPAVDLFQRTFGLDPRTIEEADPRIAQWRSDVVTTFMRELRAMLDEEGKPRKTRLASSIMVLGNEPDNLQYGVDIRRLVTEGLVDEIYSYMWDFGSKHPHYEWAYFREACRDKGIPFSPATASYFLESYYTLPLVKSFLESGAKGVAIWDASDDNIHQWSVISRFGHEEETLWRIQQLENVSPPRKHILFHRLGENVGDGRFAPVWGG